MGLSKIPLFLQPRKGPYTVRYDGVIAQLVEQWTENPCVAGSTLVRTIYIKFKM